MFQQWRPAGSKWGEGTRQRHAQFAFAFFGTFWKLTRPADILWDFLSWCPLLTISHPSNSPPTTPSYQHSTPKATKRTIYCFKRIRRGKIRLLVIAYCPDCQTAVRQKRSLIELKALQSFKAPLSLQWLTF